MNVVFLGDIGTLGKSALWSYHQYTHLPMLQCCERDILALLVVMRWEGVGGWELRINGSYLRGTAVPIINIHPCQLCGHLVVIITIDGHFALDRHKRQWFDESGF